MHFLPGSHPVRCGPTATSTTIPTCTASWTDVVDDVDRGRRPARAGRRHVPPLPHAAHDDAERQRPRPPGVGHEVQVAADPAPRGRASPTTRGSSPKPSRRGRQRKLGSTSRPVDGDAHPSPTVRRRARGRSTRDGYVVRERVFDADECAEITDACERARRRPRQGPTRRKRYHVGSYTFEPDRLTGVHDQVGGRQRRRARHRAVRPPVARPRASGRYDPRFVDPSIDFVGDDDPILFTEKLNLKRPYVGGPNPWHQDYPYWDGYADDRDRRS